MRLCWSTQPSPSDYPLLDHYDGHSVEKAPVTLEDDVNFAESTNHPRGGQRVTGWLTLITQNSVISKCLSQAILTQCSHA